MRENLPAKGPGRPKGSVNKVTKDIRDAINEAFNKAGGVEYLVSVARTKPETFCQLIAKVIPQEVKNHVDGKLEISWKS